MQKLKGKSRFLELWWSQSGVFLDWVSIPQDSMQERTSVDTDDGSRNAIDALSSGCQLDGLTFGEAHQKKEN